MSESRRSFLRLLGLAPFAAPVAAKAAFDAGVPSIVQDLTFTLTTTGLPSEPSLAELVDQSFRDLLDRINRLELPLASSPTDDREEGPSPSEAAS